VRCVVEPPVDAVSDKVKLGTWAIAFAAAYNWRAPALGAGCRIEFVPRWSDAGGDPPYAASASAKVMVRSWKDEASARDAAPPAGFLPAPGVTVDRLEFREVIDQA